MAYYQVKADTVTVQLKIKPNAKKTQVQGVLDDYLAVAVQAPPVEGAANKALIKFLAKQLNLTQKDILLKRGAQSRYKVFELPLTEKVIDWLEEYGL